MNNLKQKHFFLLLIPLIGSLIYTCGFPTPLNAQYGHHFIFTLVGLPLVFFNFNFNSFKIEKTEIYSILILIFTIHIVGFYWIADTVYVFGGIAPPFNYLLFLFSAIVISPQYWVFIILYHFYKKYLGKKKFLKENTGIVLSILLTLIEIYTPQQFPAHIGDPFITMAPYLGLSPILGKGIYSFFSIYLALSIVEAIQKKRLIAFPFVSFFIFILLNILIPLPHQKSPFFRTLNVRVVQGNIGNYLKYSSEQGDFHSIKEVTDRYFKLSTKPTKLNHLDLIIWPETAYPFYISNDSVNSYNHGTLFDVVKQSKTPLFFGGYAYKEKDLNPNQFEDAYNTGFLFTPDGKIEEKYHKQKLLPFGETLPFGPLTPYLAQIITNISYFARGNEFPLFKIQETPFIPLICYEYLLPQFVRSYLNRLSQSPIFIINLTNDSWFGDSMEPFQHLFLGKWRALEFQIPIIRSTNTGITSIIYPNGEESIRLSNNKIDFLDESIPLKERSKTIFEKWGNTPLLIFLMIFLFLPKVIGHARKKRS